MRPRKSARPVSKKKKSPARRPAARTRAAPKVAKATKAAKAPARKAKPQLAAPPALTWTQGGPRLRSARAKGGSYVLLSQDGVDWRADFRPATGRPSSVLFRQPLEACVAACERDHVLRFTNEMLSSHGAQALAAADLQGDAVAWKRRR